MNSSTGTEHCLSDSSLKRMMDRKRSRGSNDDVAGLSAPVTKRQRPARSSLKRAHDDGSCAPCPKKTRSGYEGEEQKKPDVPRIWLFPPTPGTPVFDDPRWPKSPEKLWARYKPAALRTRRRRKTEAKRARTPTEGSNTFNTTGMSKQADEEQVPLSTTHISETCPIASTNYSTEGICDLFSSTSTECSTPASSPDAPDEQSRFFPDDLTYASSKINTVSRLCEANPRPNAAAQAEIRNALAELPWLLTEEGVAAEPVLANEFYQAACEGSPSWWCGSIEAIRNLQATLDATQLFGERAEVMPDVSSGLFAAV